jgi:predicted enzyme related to lactoylglutathione lyase
MPELPGGERGLESDIEAREQREKSRLTAIEAFFTKAENVALDTARSLGFDETEIMELARQALLRAMREARIVRVDILVGLFRDKDELLQSPEVLEAAREGLFVAIRSGMEAPRGPVERLEKMLNITPEQIKSPEFQEAARASAVRGLRLGNLVALEVALTKYSVPADFAESAEVREAAYNGLASAIQSNQEKLAVALETRFNIARHEIIHNAYIADKKPSDAFYQKVFGKAWSRRTANRPLVTLAGSEPKVFYGKIWFTTEDISAVTTKILTNGGSEIEITAVEYTDVGTQKYFKDVDGNIFAVHQEEK